MDSKKKHAGGRPTKYKPELCKKLVEYFSSPPTRVNDDGQVIAIDLPQMCKFAADNDITVDTMIEWCSKHPEFSESYKKAKQLQEHIVTVNAMAGRYAPAFSIFYMKNCHGWKDRQETTVSGGQNPVVVQVVNFADCDKDGT